LLFWIYDGSLHCSVYARILHKIHRSVLISIAKMLGGSHKCNGMCPEKKVSWFMHKDLVLQMRFLTQKYFLFTKMNTILGIPLVLLHKNNAPCLRIFW
jgi:hypothetical protein